LNEVTREEFEKQHSSKEVLLITKSSNELNYNKVTYSVLSDTLFLTTKVPCDGDDNQLISRDIKIPMDNIQIFKLSKYDATASIVASIAVPLIITGVIMAIVGLNFSGLNSF
jgi:hypothetical protein